MARVRVYIACSLDGFIAAPHDDISWLEQPRPDWAPMAAGAWGAVESDAASFEDFTAHVGAMLMGRRTFDVVDRMDIEWPYGDMPILVATTRPLHDPPATVTATSGPIANLIDEALTLAGGKDVYLDGGQMIRQALDEGLVDEMTVTLHPTVLGAGHALFAGATRRHPITVTDVRRYGDGMVQLVLVPAREPVDDSPVPPDGGPADAPAEPPYGLA
ncbi:dihydrofolate reductase family protein [Demequina sp.]|uniref:dihydrofolate reductase family protein n=1 Tax=Demequina sp. TaxID=2050685 RepID=UPI003A8B294B